uniref:Putative actin n=1 Tax=Panstrongylus lignarius TaxID=156445 RepID=A0A224XQA8_9HEMI
MALYDGLSGEKPAVVLDLGARYTKFGFVGEFSPRCIIPSEIKCPTTGQIRKISSYKDEADLYVLLVEFIHKLYFKYVLVSPKDRHVVIVESLLTPTIFRDTLAKVFFKHYEVASILFVPSHLVVLCALGIRTALVVDVGYRETQVIPVYEGVPVLSAWQAQPLAASAVEQRLKDNLVESYQEKIYASGDAGRHFTPDVESLPDSVIEDIKVRGCFVPDYEHGQDISDGVPSRLPPCVDYRVGGSCIIQIPGSVRQSAYEPLFEKDNERCSLPHLILDAILKCGIDTHKELAENILLVGGSVMAPGFKARVMEEIRQMLKTPEYSAKLPIKCIKLHQPPGKENYMCWLGGAIFGATDMIPMRTLTKENYLSLKMVPDWSNLATNILLVSKLSLH